MAVSNFTGCSIYIWKVVSAHWATLSWLCRHTEPPLLLPSRRRRSHRFDSVLKARSASTMAAYGKTITPAEFWNFNLHTWFPVIPQPSLTILHNSTDGESSGGCLSIEYEGSSLGESGCLSLHSLSKATYNTPQLPHSHCQVTTPSHPLRTRETAEKSLETKSHSVECLLL